MTRRERKYHKRKWWAKWVRKMMRLAPEEFKEERLKRKERLYYLATKNGIESSTTPKSATITITKYNLPNNIGLSEGQLN